jgi:hypothetical protein
MHSIDLGQAALCIVAKRMKMQRTMSNWVVETPDLLIKYEGLEPMKFRARTGILNHHYPAGPLNLKARETWVLGCI